MFLSGYINKNLEPIIGQLELWDSKAIVLKYQKEIEEALLSFGRPNWFLTAPSISEGKNYLFTRNLKMKDGARFSYFLWNYFLDKDFDQDFLIEEIDDILSDLAEQDLITEESFSGGDMREVILAISIKANLFLESKIKPYFLLGPCLHMVKQKGLQIFNPLTDRNESIEYDISATVLSIYSGLGLDILLWDRIMLSPLISFQGFYSEKLYNNQFMAEEMGELYFGIFINAGIEIKYRF